MKKNVKIIRVLAAFTAISVLIGGIYYPQLNQTKYIASAAETADSRLRVDLNANDGRKASYTDNAENWIVPGGTSATTTIKGISFTLSNGGSNGTGIRSVNYKVLQKYDGTTPTLTMDGVTIQDGNSEGIIKLEIKGLSAGSHTLSTWHSSVDNNAISTMSVSVNGKVTNKGIKAPVRVTNSDDAGRSYSVFTAGSGETVTVLIKPEGNAAVNNSFLNAFEIDGADPINSISHISAEDQSKHVNIKDGLTWTAGKDAKSHDVYIGTDFSSVFQANKNSSVYKGNQTAAKLALDESYSSLNTYYWRVDEVKSDGTTTKGAVYSFKVNRLAFPTAEGYGRFATGGRGGRIVEVTNLNDSGKGSLRQALEVEKGARIVIFKVGGVIELKSRICIPDDGGDVYVAGQTAPGDGITLINYDFGAMGSEDVIIRNVRVRVGDMNGSSTGGMGMSSCNNCIVDHCSISWATDEGFSSRSAQNLTFQWNIIGESLHDSVHYGDGHSGTETHSFAASISGYTGSFHHNLLIDCTGRNWSLAGGMEQDGKTYSGQLDIRNNVVYNFRDRTTDGGVRRLNFVNNYYKAGIVSNESLHIVSTDGNELGTNDMQMMYVSGNKMVGYNGKVLLNPSDDAWAKGRAKSGGKNSTDADVRSDKPFFESYVNTQTADEAYKSVISAAGANSQGWDYIDSRYINEVKNNNYTFTGSKQGLKGIIDSQNDAGGYPNSSNFKGGTAPADSDSDGIPDAWETEHGLNPKNATDSNAVTLSADDYTNIEMYLNELAGDPVEFNNNTTIKDGAVIDTAHKYTIKNAGSGLLLEVAGSTAANGTDVQQGGSGADGWTLEDAGNGYYRIYSEISDGKTYLLDIDYGKTDNGTNIGIWSNTNSDAQLFKFVKNEDNTYTITTKVTDDASCLGIASDSTESGATAIEWECNGKSSQKWILNIKVDALNGNLIKNLVVSDTDNYKNWSINKSIASGDLMYGDRDTTYAVLPKELIGAESIITACDSKNSTSNLAKFTAGADITVYIAMDSRVTTIPSWLNNWTKTNLTSENNKDVIFNIYSKNVNKDDILTLGSNGQSAGCVNYTVFAAEKSVKIQGDVNADGAFTIADIVAMQKYLVNSGSLADWEAGDLINDNILNIFDLMLMKRNLMENSN